MQSLPEQSSILFHFLQCNGKTAEKKQRKEKQSKPTLTAYYLVDVIDTGTLKDDVDAQGN